MAHVLVVDDDPDIRSVIVFALRDEGHTVDEAADGFEALEAVARRHPDIILLDVKMPRMDGREFIVRYRNQHGRRAAIILVTAARDASLLREELEVEDFIAKPFDLDRLVMRVSLIAVRAAGGARQDVNP